MLLVNKGTRRFMSNIFWMNKFQIRSNICTIVYQLHFYRLVTRVLSDIELSVNPTLHPTEISCLNLNTKYKSRDILRLKLGSFARNTQVQPFRTGQGLYYQKLISFIPERVWSSLRSNALWRIFFWWWEWATTSLWPHGSIEGCTRLANDTTCQIKRKLVKSTFKDSAGWF